jgi:nitrogenase molybdenum-iron protein alpha/beta subunit
VKNLYRRLPAFAPDYSGVSAVLYEMGGLMVFHEAGGCTGGPAIFDEYRALPCPTRLFSTTLREADTVTGGDDMYVRRLVNTARVTGGDFIALLASPIPMLIGSDLPGMMRLVEKRSGVPSIAFEAYGLGFYDAGVRLAYDTLIDRFAGKDGEGEALTADVNILGVTQLDMWDSTMASDLCRIVAQDGRRTASIWGGADGLAPLRGCADSKLNIAVSYGGIAAARKLFQLFGTPYLIGFPVGRVMQRAFLAAVENGGPWPPAAEGVESAEGANAALKGRAVLIVAEQVQGSMIRHFLRAEYGADDVTVCSFFGMDADLAKAGDTWLSGEDALTELTAGIQYELALCDPMMKPLLSNQPRQFFPLPHLAVSSRMCAAQSPNLLGEKANHHAILY